MALAQRLNYAPKSGSASVPEELLRECLEEACSPGTVAHSRHWLGNRVAALPLEIGSAIFSVVGHQGVRRRQSFARAKDVACWDPILGLTATIRRT